MTRKTDAVHCSTCGGRTGLYDAARIVRELVVSEAAAWRMIRTIPAVIVPPRDVLRKTYVRGEDLDELLRRWTVEK